MQDVGLDDSRHRMRRFDMVQHQLRHRQIRSERVLEAMTAVPRHLFAPSEQRERAYESQALSIGFGQTLSDPYTVSLMLECLKLTGHERVLEVGTGSGYQAALLALLAEEVYSVEIVPELARRALETIEQLGFNNVKVVLGDGSVGLALGAPYDAIVVNAAAPEVPSALLDQLQDGGTLAIPVGDSANQKLLRVRKRGGRVTTKEIGSTSFVSLLGRHGWRER